MIEAALSTNGIANPSLITNGKEEPIGLQSLSTLPVVVIYHTFQDYPEVSGHNDNSVNSEDDGDYSVARHHKVVHSHSGDEKDVDSHVKQTNHPDMYGHMTYDHAQQTKLMPGSQLTGDVLMVPHPIMAPMYSHVVLSSPSVDSELVYVNPKQYNRILQRRQARARLSMRYKILPRQPYLHTSRHRHATKRKRGPGGRFLSQEEKKKRSRASRRNGDDGDVEDQYSQEDGDVPQEGSKDDGDLDDVVGDGSEC